ncbi:6952_t:CDS:10 [Acaulospora morrowiae]|uniref:6952_t:CDS:1 n=1 Tax=Acaulospora morrowiae TaxID=94023 RepID=A0A9N9GI55_9GLOM|nr:6952_t:CDS:10 [Acaulospora morrowiae]
MGIFEKSNKTIITEYLDQCVLKAEDDWGLIISACDAVNASDNGAKEAVKFIKKKISKQQPPNVQYKALSILRAMADNCGAKFHGKSEIASKKFLDELELVAISSQTDPLVKEKIIGILGELSVMFEDEPSLWQVSYLFGRLAGASVQRQSTTIEPQQYSNPTRTTPAKPSLEKIVEDVELAKNNTQLFTQMISFTDPEVEDITKNELIQEFRGKCETLRKTIMQYISVTQDEQWLNTLISTNQDIVNAFKMYNEMVERGQITMAKEKSKDTAFRTDYDHEDSENHAGVGGSGTSKLDPFSDVNEINPDSTAPRRSERSRGKMPASIYHDETLFEEDESDLNDKSQYPPNLTEYGNNGSNNTNGRQEHAVI